MSVFLDTMRAYPDLLSACGVVGSIIYISGFALVQSGRTCGNGPFYSVSKIIAAILVLISLAGAFNLGAFIIQVGFIIFGLLGLGRQFASKRGTERVQSLPTSNSLNVTAKTSQTPLPEITQDGLVIRLSQSA